MDELKYLDRAERDGVRCTDKKLSFPRARLSNLTNYEKCELKILEARTGRNRQ